MNIREYFKEVNILDLSEQTKISYNAIKNVVTGKTPNPGIYTVKRLLNALGYDIIVSKTKSEKK
jgi:predicted transcriptional regulator